MKKIKARVSKTPLKKSAKKLVSKSKKTSQKKDTTACLRFPIVGIGASAGGLDAFTQLLKALPVNTGMAFVIVQHLDPHHSSILSVALSKVTKMKVSEITDGMRIDPNQVYVIPPGTDIAILKNEFSLFPRDPSSRPHMAIDFFFRALAVECGNQAIGVVLSGNANDGTEGLRAIKAENGVTLVQDPKTAKFDGMPQSAVKAEVADYCLSIPLLAKELVRLSSHPFISGSLTDPLSDPKDLPDLKKIMVLLRTDAGVDFSEYKSPTIKRRLARRMALLKIDNLKNYIKLLQSDPKEIKAVGADVLIHVTSFFRDPEVFKSLKDTTFPEMIQKKNLETPIRIWVTGCSSGEEVYSIAIALLEFLADRAAQFSIQMFGSDISEAMIEKARSGFYSEASVRGMEPERLERFFMKVEGGYLINRLVRDLCVFVRHDLARDPPFSKLDLVTCRNVLIYFEPALQKRIIATFHYCLNQHGFLLLGRAESISGYHQLFSVVDKTNKIFEREGVTSQLKFQVMQSSSTQRPSRPTMVTTVPVATNDATKQIDTLLLTRYAPAGVVVNEKLEVLQFRGRTGLYLEAPPGQPQLNLMKMVRDGLFSALKMAIGQAMKKMVTVRKDRVQFTHHGVERVCNLVIIPISRIPPTQAQLFLILFENEPDLLPVKKSRAKKTSLKKVDGSAKLRFELKTTQEYLESLNDDYQKTNDTLNAMNEELVSGNEELQSMNEELETAKEELQSTNEELNTVNEELQNRNQETAMVNDDLINLLNSVDIPILILDMDRRIRRFTPKARNIMNLLPSDIGRQIDDIKPNILIENLDQRIKEVIQTNQIQEVEVKDRKGRWQRLQIRPYQTIDHKIAGAILSLINVDILRKAVIDAEWVRDYANSIVEAVQIPLLVLDESIKVVSANQIFYESFGGSKTSTEGASLYDLNNGRWDNENLKRSLSRMILKKDSFINTQLSCNLDTEITVMSLSAHPILSHNGQGMILLAIENITDRKNREKEHQILLTQAQLAKQDADKANLTKDLFLATLSHELRTPLTALIMQAQLLRRGNLDEAKIKKASASIERAAKVQTQLIEDLLDVSRIVTGKLLMESVLVDLNEVIHAAIDTLSNIAESKGIILDAELDANTKSVWGDAVRLQQVVWNLLTNAIKFTPRGNHVKVTLKPVIGFAEIQVIDTGIGISEEFLPQVFNRFSQAEETNTRTHGGLGLGLAIVRHLTQLHGGSVSVKSLGENRGTTFTVLIPFPKDAGLSPDFPALKVKSAALHSSRAIRLDGQKIMVVEDDFGVREALTELLGEAGADVRSAGSAVDAMNVLRDFTPDQLVMDVAMPGENGYSLLGRIRALDLLDGPIIPAIALTALATEKDRDEALAAGFQLHLIKPLDIDRLTIALRDLHHAALSD